MAEGTPEDCGNGSVKATGKMSLFGHLFRFVGKWFGFTYLYAMFAVCPCCGQRVCPVGIASAGTVGAFFALCYQDWRLLFRVLKQKLVKNKDDMSTNKVVREDEDSAVVIQSRQ